MLKYTLLASMFVFTCKSIQENYTKNIEKRKNHNPIRIITEIFHNNLKKKSI